MNQVLVFTVVSTGSSWRWGEKPPIIASCWLSHYRPDLCPKGISHIQTEILEVRQPGASRHESRCKYLTEARTGEAEACRGGNPETPNLACFDPP